MKSATSPARKAPASGYSGARAPRASQRLDLDPFVRELQGLDRDLVALGLQIGRLDLRRERVAERPLEHGLVVLVQQVDDDLATLRLSERARALPPLKELVVRGEGAALERHVRVLLHARHADLRVLAARALAVLDELGLRVETRDLGEPDAAAAPLNFEMEFGKRVGFRGHRSCSLSLRRKVPHDSCILCAKRRTMNSAGRTAARPISTIMRPSSTSCAVMVRPTPTFT